MVLGPKRQHPALQQTDTKQMLESAGSDLYQHEYKSWM